MTVSTLLCSVVACGLVWNVSPSPSLPAAFPESRGTQVPFSTRTDLVRVAVSALDKNGRPVPDLTAADFTILEHGKRRDILVFDASNSGAQPQARLIVLIFDAWFPPEIQRSARQAALKVIDTLTPEDTVAVVRAGAGTDDRLDFTANQQRLLAAVDAALDSPKPSLASGRKAVGSSCAADHVVRIANGMRERTDRSKRIYFVGSSMFDRDSTSSCRADQMARRDAVEQAASDTDITIETFDPRHPSGADLLWAFVGYQYVLGFVPGDVKTRRPSNIEIQIKRRDVARFRWVFQVR